MPEAVVAKQGVGEHDELADDGGYCDLVRLAAVGQPLVDGAHVGVATAGGDGGHVEHLARSGSPASDVASAVGCAAVAGERRRAGQGRGLLGADAAEFGQVGAKHSCGDGADTRDGPQDRGAASQGFVGFEGLGNGLVEHTDLAVGSLVEAAERGRRGSGTEFGDALATVCPILDTGGSGRQQVLQLLEIAFQWKRPAPARQAPEESQHGGIDAIGLGEPTHAARKLPGLERVGQDDLQAGLVEAALQGPMVAVQRQLFLPVATTRIAGCAP